MELKPKQGSLKIWMRRLVGVALIVTVFVLGMAVGDGRININPRKQSVVANELSRRPDYNSVNEVYKSLRENFDGELTDEQVTNGLKHGLADSTNDPYTVYLTPEEAKEFEGQLNNSFSGIGAQLGQDKDKNLEVIAAIDGLPADKAGVKAKDIIASINGQSTSGMSVDEAVGKIRGPKGTKVKLGIVRDRSEQLNFDITREDIKLPSVKTKIIDGSIGYLQITTFSDDTIRLVNEAATDFKNKGVKAMIVDVRSNPGGLLDGAVSVSDLWLNQGQTILQEKRGGEVIKTYTAQNGGTFSGLPTVVLIDGGSASASEILAGALRDNNSAYLIGEKSYGKGVVQQLINFGNGSQLKITVASWFRPNGQNINKKGIQPDKVIKISDEDAKADKDTQLQAAQDYLKTKLNQ